MIGNSRAQHLHTTIRYPNLRFEEVHTPLQNDFTVQLEEECYSSNEIEEADKEEVRGKNLRNRQLSLGDRQTGKKTVETEEEKYFRKYFSAEFCLLYCVILGPKQKYNFYEFIIPLYKYRKSKVRNGRRNY